MTSINYNPPVRWQEELTLPHLSAHGHLDDQLSTPACGAEPLPTPPDSSPPRTAPDAAQRPPSLVTPKPHNEPRPARRDWSPSNVRLPANSAQQHFIERVQDAARATQAKTGIPADFMIAQAALETGWGRHNIRNADGTSANNLFGIKAGRNWKGPVAEVTTTEYHNGVACKVVAKFRAYASIEESFADYAQLLTKSRRYAQVVANSSDAHGFARGLQQAGYATDPAYADKLIRMIETTQRVQTNLAGNAPQRAASPTA